MSSADIKAARVVMRQVEEHLRQSHINSGASDEPMGFVDVVHHTSSSLACLNYVTPRRNTAWVSAQHIEKGLDALRSKGRLSRVRFVEGLYPPVFARSLRELGLRAESETPIMVYKVAETRPAPIALPHSLSVQTVEDHQGMAMWWYVWRNAFYDVMTSGFEPLLLGSDIRDMYLGKQHNIILYRHGFPIGVSRLTIHGNTAHLVAHALFKEVHTPERERLLIDLTLESAIQQGCELIFAAGHDDNERQLLRGIGFSDAGSIVSYAEPNAQTDDTHDTSQVVLVI